MKRILLLSFSLASLCGLSQSSSVTSLPMGKYETFLKQSQNKWVTGDIILLSQNQYKVSSTNEVGEYRFSASAQRVFFVTGPLKAVFAKTGLTEDKPSILLPFLENEQQGLKMISADIVGYHRD
jgi:hypothetical protein